MKYKIYERNNYDSYTYREMKAEGYTEKDAKFIAHIYGKLQHDLCYEVFCEFKKDKEVKALEFETKTKKAVLFALWTIIILGLGHLL
jgi:hypothetical protein